jgi:hypothetical protein
VHVGISATTGISVATQYLDVVKLLGFCPAHIPTDRGTETMVMANGYWQLAQWEDSDIDFKSIYWYGTSKMNQAIEQWWSRLKNGQTKQWKVSNNSISFLKRKTNHESNNRRNCIFYRTIICLPGLK